MDREDLVLLFRNEAGVLMKKTARAEHVAFFKSADITPHVQSSWDIDPRILAAVVQGDWIRVSFKPGYWDRDRPNKWTGKLGMWVAYREEVCKEWERKFKLLSYEGDVTPLRRYISDHGLEIARPRRCYLDLETDSRASFPMVKGGKSRILCWAIVAEDGQKFSGLLNHDDTLDEIRILTELWNVLERFDQVVAWNGDGFDFPVLKARTKELQIPVKDVRRWTYLDQMLCFKRNNIMSSSSGDEKQSFRLEAIAQALLGEGKHDVDGSKTWEYWIAGGTERTKLLEYNIQDTDLLRRVEEKTGYLELHQTLCEVTRVFPDTKSLKPTQQVDGYMLRLGVEESYHFSTKWFGDDKEVSQFAGAFVMDPVCDGIEHGVFVADFASLYPSIMITWNLSPDTRLTILEEGGIRDEHECFSPSNRLLTDNTHEGILCKALVSLMGLRAKWKKIKAGCHPGTPEAKDAERRTNAYKTAANSFYGVMGTPYSRYYDRDICEATTQNGAWLIKLTMAEAEKRGWKVIYGDTDSLFIQGCTATEFADFVKWCNEILYPTELRDQGCRTNLIKLACDKEFSILVMTTAKRYAGKHADSVEGAKPEIKGLEFKRGDCNKTARMLQGEAIDMIITGQEDPLAFVEMIERYKKTVLEGDLPIESIVVTKQITKELAEYVQKRKMDGSESAALPHVQVAKTLLDRGQDITVGSRVGYVVIDADESPMTVIPADDYTGVCDRFYLWEALVYPPTERFLSSAFPRHDWSKWKVVRPPKVRLRTGPEADPRQLSLLDRIDDQTLVINYNTSQLGGGSCPIVAPWKKAKTNEAE